MTKDMRMFIAFKHKYKVMVSFGNDREFKVVDRANIELLLNLFKKAFYR